MSMADSMMTTAAWKQRISGYPSSNVLDRVQVLLMNYHRQQGIAKDERMQLLQSLIDEVGPYLTSHAPSDPLFAPLFEVSSAAFKKIREIKHVGEAMKKMRQIFGPSGGTLGGPRTIQHHNAKAAVPTSSKNYWLEALDPMHRSWGHEDNNHHYFDQWLADVGSTLSFFEWLQQKGLANDWPRVVYLDPSERWKYMIVFGEDRRLYRHKPTLGERGKGDIPVDVFSTKGMNTAFNGNHYAIWVCSSDGIVYSHSHIISEFHHSSFLAGRRVAAAGEWVVSGGRLLLVSHKTGHYMATPQNLVTALKHLEKRTDISRTVVQSTDFSTRTDRYFTAIDWIKNAGDASKCQPVFNNQTKLPMVNMNVQACERCKRDIDWDGQHPTGAML